MTDQRDLFNYPLQPGFKDTDTSKAAAQAMKPTAATLRSQCLRCLAFGDYTADEVALDFLRESVLSIRPRFSELKRLGKIEDTGQRRRNASGKSAIVWKAKP